MEAARERIVLTGRQQRSLSSTSLPYSGYDRNPIFGSACRRWILPSAVRPAAENRW